MNKPINYQWNQDTVSYFVEQSKTKPKYYVQDQVYSFIDNQCQLEHGDKFSDLFSSLISNIYPEIIKTK